MSLFHIPRDSILDFNFDEPETISSREVVRLSTSMWSDKNGVHVKRSLRHLRRKCVLWNAFEEEVSCVGVEEAIGSLTNLNECEDGVYEIICIGVHRDWETEEVDEWHYKLIPFEEDTLPNDDTSN